MSGFDLVPVDGGAPVHLPSGETVLGRGPLLGVNDKRVSRHHGLLENLNGQLRLKPTHMNPCFTQSSPADVNPRPLKKDSWYPLRHGDFFSLLPGQFVYKVVAVGGAERTPRNSQRLEEEEEEELPGSPEPHVEPAHPVITDCGQTPPHQGPMLAALSDEDVNDKRNRSFNKGDSAPPEEVEDDHSDVAPSVKRRVLPAWMMAAASGPHRASSSPRGQSAVKRSKAPAGASTSTKPAAAKKATPTATEGAELSEEEKRPRKRRRKISDEEEDEEAGTKTDVPSEEPAVPFQRGSNRSEVSAESDNLTMEEEEEEEEEEEGGGGEPSSADRTTTTRRSGRESEKEDEKSKDGQQTTKRAEAIGSNGGAASTSSLRTACPYGKDCYRKNPVHFQECSHPGDTDYEEEEEEEEEEADRPECPYGTDCYRKNPLHRKEYKHTKKPARATRAAPKKSPAGDEDEDEDEDSFINDDSEDVGDDSDYVPPDSDDSGKEDIKRLQREAKVFLKRRK